MQTSTPTDYSNVKLYRSWAYGNVSSLYTRCSTTGLTADAYYASCVDTCTDTDLTSPSTEACHAKAILTAIDVLYTSSYIASCEFLTNVAYNVTQSSSADSECDKLGDGFVYLFCAHFLIGVFYICVVCTGIKGNWVWDAKNNFEVEHVREEGEGPDSALDHDSDLQQPYEVAVEMEPEPKHHHHHNIGHDARFAAAYDPSAPAGPQTTQYDHMMQTGRDGRTDDLATMSHQHDEV